MTRSVLLGCTVLALALSRPAAAQGIAPDAPDLAAQPAQAPPPATAATAAATPDDIVDFSAATLDYDRNSDVVVATGDVRMTRQGNRLRADKVTWNRKSGAVVATGKVAVVNPGGDTAYGDHVTLTDSLKDGVVDNMLLVLADGGRLAAVRGTRKDGVDTLDRAAYSPCPVVGDDGCPKQPLWEITAVRVVHDPARRRVYYNDARIKLFGVPILWLPQFSHPDGSGGGGPGLLVPDFRYSRTNGAEIALPYYIKLHGARDLTLTPHVYSGVLPSLEAKYRELNSLGAFELGGLVTYGSRLPARTGSLAGTDSDRDVRGYLYAHGRYQLDPQWSITASGRLASDRTFLRRYQISHDDRLRSTVNVERIDDDSYLSIAGWAVQTLRVGDTQGAQPVALPAIDYRRRVADPLLGGVLTLQANTLALLRTEGQDTQRAFAAAQYDLRMLTPMGQQVTFTAYARGDVYHTAHTAETSTVSYRGDAGFEGRGIGALAIDVRWPFVGALAGGTQQITPRLQVVASPPTRNLAIPNEDARAVDLEDSNLFALNRFNGYDRWEDGTRVTYGLEYAYDRPRFSLRTVIGQSYRFTDKPSIFPPGTGLSARHSDIVGRTTIDFDDLISLTHRYRLDKDSLAIRRNEIDATIGSRSTYVTAGYLRLNRNVSTDIEDLRDREEIRLGARLQMTKYWSMFGSTTIDLTGRHEDPTSLADGFDPIRHRIGIAYEDNCLQLGLTWRRDYDEAGDARKGNTFTLQLALKNLGI